MTRKRSYAYPPQRQAWTSYRSCPSHAGPLALFWKNVLVAYMPGEYYNYEDAVLISERLVYEYLSTFFHIRNMRLRLM